MDAGSSSGVLDQLDAFREELLSYDAEADKSGTAWDAHRVALDAQLLAIRAVVEDVARSCPPDPASNGGSSG